ncbi:hypothetical protein DVA67_025360 [Solirubrobacter sp. CPCC 204708]|uniref:Uncharacterized protein n=1 Tax=Solirubrobacter deserti TaxID=2282478 RepID=A0ABT4RUR1_9ACTN|nr:hypothetical protein [Solirubrobacter deserti]MBE2319330.1 hypothetical protein [Solirubrobacter deserti]MDA0142308.1 hypothetical protein [Solirubrobacter deserti]
MTAFAPETGMLTASRGLINALVQATVTGEGDTLAVDALLAEVGAGSLAAPHPALAAALEPLTRPIIGVRLAKTGFVMPGWIGEGRFTLHVHRRPTGEDDQLVSMPAGQLLHFLVWLLDVGPRPRDPRPPETTVPSEALNRAIAFQLGDRATTGLLPEPLDAAIAGGFRDWWLASARWPAAPDRPGSFTVEVIDTDAGLWSVEQREDGTAVVRPLTPLGTLLALAELVPDNDLVDQTAPRLPVQDTPIVGGQVKWVGDALR